MSAKAARILVLVTLLAAALAACSSSGSSKSGPERQSCRQARDCGEGGLQNFVCSDGLCFTRDEYCYSDDECLGACLNHLCEGGKRPAPTDGDLDSGDGDAPVDGDAEPEEEGEPEQGVCDFVCCVDEDCAENSYCDTVKHECVALLPCEAGEDCCEAQDYYCWKLYGRDYACIFTACVGPDHPCPYACCTNADCEEGSVCVMADGPEQGTCRRNTYSCTPNAVFCCGDDPGNPDCLALGERIAGGVLTCNAAGDAAEVSTCADYHDCFPGPVAGTISCEPNGSCGTEADCVCPNACVDTPNGKRCMLKPLQSGEVCYTDKCGNGPQIIGRCPDELKCCVDGQTNQGTCGNCK